MALRDGKFSGTKPIASDNLQRVVVTDAALTCKSRLVVLLHDMLDVTQFPMQIFAESTVVGVARV